MAPRPDHLTARFCRTTPAWLGSLVGWLLVGMAATMTSAPARAEQGGAGRPDEARGVFVTVPSPITSATFQAVKRECETALRNGAGVFVFDIQPGGSDYGNCLNLAHYIEEISLGQRGTGQGVKTVAYVSGALAGHAVLVALAADELVMSEKAELGPIVSRDERFIGRGMQTEYAELAHRRKPGYEAVVLGMLVKDYRVWKVQTAKGTRYVLDEELKKVESEEAVRSKEVLIDKGQLPSFTGEQLREIGLARLIAASRAAVAEAYGLPPKTALEPARGDGQIKAVHIRISGMIDPLLDEYVRRHVKAAREEGKNFFIFEIDSDGGYARVGTDIAEFIRDELKDATTIAYIPDRAISAAAFIALGCDRIVMHRNAKLGDCGVMFGQQGSPYQYVPEKELSYFRTVLDTLAHDKGYPPALVQAFIDKDLVVKEVHDPETGGTLYLSEEALAEKGHEKLQVVRTVKPAGRFLTMDGETALGLGFSSDVVDNFDGLRVAYGLENTRITVIDQNWVDTLIWVLNTRFVAGLLIVIGLIGLYVEVKMPGVALPGIVAALCFLLFFWSRFMGGTATALEILLFLAGLLCLGLEIFVIPGFGVFGLTGILLMFFSIVLASQTFILPHTPDDWDQLSWNLGSLLMALGCLFAFAFLVSKYLPEMPILGRMVLKPELVGLPADDGSVAIAGPLDELAGQLGVAVTSLRPAGRVRLGDQFIDVVTDGSYIAEGARVRVIEVWGRRVVVKEA
jgi:membrane-bound serine protease (ClpP class)